jgi:hypothetical protein
MIGDPNGAPRTAAVASASSRWRAWSLYGAQRAQAQAVLGYTFGRKDISERLAMSVSAWNRFPSHSTQVVATPAIIARSV